MTTQKDYLKTALRLPRDLHRAVHEAGAASDRSFNGEILWRLRQSFAPAAPQRAQKADS